MNQKEQMIKKVIMIFLMAAFCISVFLIAAGKYGLWNLWFTDVDKKQVLEILSEDARWKHLNAKQEPGVGNVWTTQEYNAEGWETITGEYSEDADETGTTTAFFRYEFDLEDAGKYKYMEGNIEYADAVIVYLNGNIIFAGNVPDGGYYSNLDMGACNVVDTKRESFFVVTDLRGLVSGKNIIAVEVHRKDKTSRDINFHFQNLNVFETEYKENRPDTEGIVLQKGEEADAVEIDWITELPESYKIEYMEGTLDTVRRSTFSEYAHTVIMGNRELSSDMTYRKSGQIRRLKERTDYVYRVMRIGGKEGSQLYQFRTAEKQETSFLYTGMTQIDSLSEAANVRSWRSHLKKAVDTSDKIDYLIAGKLIASTKDLMNNELQFRSAQQLKEIPVIESEVNLKQEVDHELDRASRAYMDLLLISLNTNDKDYDGVHTYIKNIMVERNRKWNIVILSAPEAIEQNTIDEKYLEMFKELDIDVVLINGSMEYYSAFSGEMTDNADENSYIKKRGETLFTCGGNMAITIHVLTEKVELKVYDAENKALVEEIQLTKLQ